MLEFAPLPAYMGIELIGDYGTLRQLHQTTHKVAKNLPDGIGRESLLGLAYDARKAVEGQRKIYPPPPEAKEVGTLLGVDTMWPVLLWQARMLRCGLQNMPGHDAFDQSVIFALEGVIEFGLKATHKNKAQDVIAAWRELDPTKPESEADMLARSWVYEQWNALRRLNSLSHLIKSFSPSFDWDEDHGVSRDQVRQGYLQIN